MILKTRNKHCLILPALFFFMARSSPSFSCGFSCQTGKFFDHLFGGNDHGSSGSSSSDPSSSSSADPERHATFHRPEAATMSLPPVDSTRLVTSAASPAKGPIPAAAKTAPQSMAIPPVGASGPVRGARGSAQMSGSLPRLAAAENGVSQVPAIPSSSYPPERIFDSAGAPHVDDAAAKVSGQAQRIDMADQYLKSAEKKFDADHMISFESGIKDLDRVIALMPNYEKAYVLRSAAHNRIGEFNRAEQDAREAIKLSPMNSSAWFNLAVAQLMQSGYKEAKESADKAMELLSPESPAAAQASWVRAEALEAMGLRDAAMSDAQRAAGLEPMKFAGRFKTASDGGKLFDPTNKDVSYLFRADPGYMGGESSGWTPALAGLLILFLGVGVAKRRSGRKASSASGPTAPAASADGVLKYQMIRIIGRGGMGEVYEALDRSLNRTVAIKKMASGLSSAAERAARRSLLKEAGIVAALHHPAIVDIYEILERGHDLFLVFELVRGKTLQQILAENKRLGPTHTLQVFGPVCEALSFAHGHDVVHRDLKPSNIMITEQGHVKVMDFGIARNVTEHATPLKGWAPGSSAESRLEQASSVAGTPIYMAPETGQGIVSKESDVYSLGCCLYETLTGVPPFFPANAFEDKLEMRFAPASSYVEGLPAAIDILIRESLEPRVDQRLKTPAQFLAKLEAAFAAAGPPASSTAVSQ